jgi:hypothetical protein
MTLYKKAFLLRETVVLMGRMRVQRKQVLSQTDKRIIVILFMPILAIVLLIAFFASIIPVQVTMTETRTRKVLSYHKVHYPGDDSRYPDYVNVTNYDTIGGTFLVIMNKTSHPFDYAGPFWEVTVEDTTEQSMFIAAGDNGIFNVPQGWEYVTYEVTVPTKQEEYNVTETELKSIIDILGNKP